MGLGWILFPNVYAIKNPARNDSSKSETLGLDKSFAYEQL